MDAYLIVPGEEPPRPVDKAEADLEFWRTLHLLREHKRGLAGHGNAGRRAHATASPEEVTGAVGRLIREVRRRGEQQEKWGTPSCDGR